MPHCWIEIPKPSNNHRMRFEIGPKDLGADWPGGFYCPCHGSKFDLAGRVYSGLPAPLNMVVPPHRYLGENIILIGDDTGVRA